MHALDGVDTRQRKAGLSNVSPPGSLRGTRLVRKKDLLPQIPCAAEKLPARSRRLRHLLRPRLYRQRAVHNQRKAQKNMVRQKHSGGIRISETPPFRK